MIQATPQIELAQPDFIHVQEYDAGAQFDTNEPSAFAKILAGLTDRDTASEAAKAGTDEYSDKSAQLSAELSAEAPFAENADYAIGAYAGEIIPENAAETAIAQGGTVLEAREIEPATSVSHQEYAPPSFSQQEKNIFSAENSLIGQADAAESQAAAKKDLVSQAKAFPADSQQPANADAGQAGGRTEFAGHGGAENQTTGAVAGSGEIHPENSKNTGELARGNVADAPAGSKQTVQQAAVETAAAEMPKQPLQKNNAVGERDGRGRLEEARNKDRRRAAFDARDSRGAGVQAETVQRDNAFQMRPGAETRIPAGETAREITLELRLPNQGQDAPSAQTTWEVRSGQAFESILARELHQNFNNDIVRHASVMLREANEATIRLALKPENLGNVKIHLEMAENKIVGHIIVESEEALRAFEREISSLERAFQESGYAGAELDMFLAADGREARQRWQEMDANRNLPRRYAASRYDTAVEQTEMPLAFDFYRQGAGAVNMLA